jgi:type I restriction enzyme S subunit
MVSGDVHLKRIVDVSGRISHEGLNASNAKIVKPPAVAIALAGQGKTRGTAAIVLVPLCTNQSVALIKPRTHRLDVAYLYHCFEFRYEELRSRSAGAGRAGLSKGLIEAIPVPLPEGHVQRKIAEILDNVDRVIQQTEALITKYERIRAGLLQSLLTRGLDKCGLLRPLPAEAPSLYEETELGWLPRDWTVKTLSELTLKIVDGVHHTPRYFDSGVPFVTVKNLTSTNDIDFRDINYVSKRDHLLFVKRADPKKGDVLVTKDGTLGVARIVKTDADFSIFVSVALLRPDPSLCIAEWLWLFFESGAFQRQLGTLSAGTGLRHIHLEHFRRFLIATPPLPEQERISTVVKKIQHFVDMENIKLANIQNCRSGLMQDLLTGRVSVTTTIQPDEVIARL